MESSLLDRNSDINNFLDKIEELENRIETLEKTSKTGKDRIVAYGNSQIAPQDMIYVREDGIVGIGVKSGWSGSYLDHFEEARNLYVGNGYVGVNGIPSDFRIALQVKASGSSPTSDGVGVIRVQYQNTTPAYTRSDWYCNEVKTYLNSYDDVNTKFMPIDISGCQIQFNSGSSYGYPQILTIGSNGDIFTIPWTDYSGSSTVVGWSGFTTKQIYYKKLGKLMFVNFYIQGTSSSALSSFTLPYSNNSQLATLDLIAVADNTTWQTLPGHIRLGTSASVVNCYKTILDGSWTASGSKIIQGEFWYETS